MWLDLTGAEQGPVADSYEEPSRSIEETDYIPWQSYRLSLLLMWFLPCTDSYSITQITCLAYWIWLFATG
jgi:hypothetical protein